MQGKPQKKEVKMIRMTVGKIARDLEEMTHQHMPIGTAFDVLARGATTVEEQVVLEVMKESFQEMCHLETRLAS